MPRHMKKASKKAGLPPGTLVHVGKEPTAAVSIKVMHYGAERMEEKEVKSSEEIPPYLETSGVTWIDVNGVHDLTIIEAIGKYLNIHPLTMEDIANTNQRPKVENFEDHLFIVAKMIYYDENRDHIEIEQLSLLLGSNYVVSFQEREMDVFNPVRERIRKDKARIRTMGPDYLAYALLDAIVDNYFIVLEKIAEKIELLEYRAIEDPEMKTLEQIHNLKRELVYLRKSVWPLRDAVSALEREETNLISDKTLFFLKDLHDHTIRIIDTTETLRDIIAGIQDLYLSSVSNRMNSIMKVLTIIATLFIPLTFIVGIYGMNFKFMPELEWRWGYPLVWLIMVLVGLAMLLYFKKKRWL
jgi:magnesium transporter